jgi:hypothetical protein
MWFVIFQWLVASTTARHRWLADVSGCCRVQCSGIGPVDDGDNFVRSVEQVCDGGVGLESFTNPISLSDDEDTNSTDNRASDGPRLKGKRRLSSQMSATMAYVFLFGCGSSDRAEAVVRSFEARELCQFNASFDTLGGITQRVAVIAENRFRSRMKLRLLHAATNRFCAFDDSQVMKTWSQWWTRRGGCIGGTPFLWWVSDRRPCGNRSFLEGLESTLFFLDLGLSTIGTWAGPPTWP